ncbi:MAG: MBOAT family O-acyltransferase [Oscillospiraceae bacterium]
MINIGSLKFIIFVLVTAAVYLKLPRKYQNIFLLAASYTFYMWAIPAYAVFIGFSTFLTYGMALLLGHLPDGKKRKLVFAASLLLNLGVLFVFKYYNFFMESICGVFSFFGSFSQPSLLSLAAPLGISFYTFQTVGYTIDIHRRSLEPEKNFVTYALFVSFFPQIVSGPIGRAKELLPQFKTEHRFCKERAVDGAQRFVYGLFKKAVIADGLSVIVNTVYGDLGTYKGIMLIFAAAAYAVQIYCDFSGYTSMALGAAKFLGFELRENFNAPYYAENISGFWKRWHMSLTTWLQDYIFIPLVWSRWANKLFFGKNADKHAPHIAANIVILFLLSGLWHGASWNFVVWGLLHALFRLGEELVHKVLGNRPRKLKSGFLNGLRHAAKSFLVFFLTAFAHIFFALPTLSDSAYVIRESFSPFSFSLFKDYIFRMLGANIASGAGYIKFYALMLFLCIVFAALLDRITYCAKLPGTKQYNPLAMLGSNAAFICTALMVTAILLFGSFGSSNFIYFKF